ncbi:MAG: hypothetical protein WKF64_08425 [Ilumatobacteraceae bacterium]
MSETTERMSRYQLAITINIDLDDTTARAVTDRIIDSRNWWMFLEEVLGAHDYDIVAAHLERS